MGGPLGGAALAGLAGAAFSPAEEFFKASIDREVAAKDVARIARHMGQPLPPRERRTALGGPDTPTDVPGWAQDVLDRVAGDISNGRRLPTSIYDIEHRLPHPLRGTFHSKAQDAMYGEAAILRFGLPDSSGEMGGQEMARRIFGTSFGDELQSAAALQGLGMTGMAAQVRQGYEDRVRLDAQITVGSKRTATAAFAISRAARYGGSQNALAAAMFGTLTMAGLASNMRQRAGEMRRRGNVAEAAALELEADLQEAQFGDSAMEEYFGSRTEEIEAFSARAEGSASRGFERALYGGGSASSLPWQSKQRALEGRASRIEGLMRERAAAGMLSPAMRSRMQEEIDQARFEASFGVARDREGAINRERLLETGLAGARQVAGEVPGILRGSATDRAREFELQGEILQKQQQTLEQILATSRFLTNEQKLQLETQVASLRAEQERVRVGGTLARIQGGIMISDRGASHMMVESEMGFLRGAGGADATALGGQAIAAIDQRIGIRRSAIERLRAEGFDGDSPEVMAQEEAIDQLRLQRERTNRGRSTIPMGPGSRERMSNLQTGLAFFSAGYGSFGDIRANLRAQMGEIRNYLDELGQNRSKLIGQGDWTPAMQADYTETVNRTRLQGLELMQAHDEGWMDRLVSAAYNSPGQGVLAMSRFTRREAAMSGMFHPGFGGSEEQTRHARERSMRTLSMFGAGRRDVYPDHGWTFATKVTEPIVVKPEVKIVIEDRTAHGVRANASAANSFKTAQDANENPTGRKMTPP